MSMPSARCPDSTQEARREARGAYFDPASAAAAACVEGEASRPGHEQDERVEQVQRGQLVRVSLARFVVEGDRHVDGHDGGGGRVNNPTRNEDDRDRLGQRGEGGKDGGEREPQPPDESTNVQA